MTAAMSCRKPPLRRPNSTMVRAIAFDAPTFLTCSRALDSALKRGQVHCEVRRRRGDREQARWMPVYKLRMAQSLLPGRAANRSRRESAELEVLQRAAGDGTTRKIS